ncbi:Aim12p-like protein [Purpureocillium lavendulum]|uniref:Aim12p-like protein n=1 Tax=Purpureocillium lavendulum TaxID=1247861 RepID=A0AB34FM65_9HYPO|nr:Aim12p-like protein [Purpureocillium lavendulum]
MRQLQRALSLDRGHTRAVHWAHWLTAPAVIGIAGIPGSGKTTLAQIISSRINERAAKSSSSSSSSSSHPPSPSPSADAAASPSPPPATYLPMDGFHLTRATLSSMADPARAHARRGAAFTFDAPKFLALVRRLRATPLPASPILAPSFDHAVKDPRDDDIPVLASHRVVVLEGNYLALDDAVWRDAAALLDELWFVDVDFQVARKRLRERHVRAGIARDLDEGDRRATENDLVNGEQIVSHRLKVDEVVVSKEDGAWVHE